MRLSRGHGTVLTCHSTIKHAIGNVHQRAAQLLRLNTVTRLLMGDILHGKGLGMPGTKMPDKLEPVPIATCDWSEVTRTIVYMETAARALRRKY